MPRRVHSSTGRFIHHPSAETPPERVAGAASRGHASPGYAGVSTPAQGAPHRHLQRPRHPNKLQRAYRGDGNPNAGTGRYGKQLAAWKKRNKDVFHGMNSAGKLARLKELMNLSSCNGGAGLPKRRQADLKDLGFVQLEVLRMMAAHFHELDRIDQCRLLSTFVADHLRYMITRSNPLYDAQRLAVRMLSSLIPRIREPDSRAALLVRLMDAFNRNAIAIRYIAAGALTKLDTASELALQIIRRELKIARRDCAAIGKATMKALQKCYNAAIMAFDPQMPDYSRQQGSTWQSVFKDKYLNPSRFEKWHAQSEKLAFKFKRLMEDRRTRQRIVDIYGKVAMEMAYERFHAGRGELRRKSGQKDEEIRDLTELYVRERKNSAETFRQLTLQRQQQVHALKQELKAQGGIVEESRRQLMSERSKNVEYHGILTSLGIVSEDGRLNRSAYRRLLRDRADAPGRQEGNRPTHSSGSRVPDAAGARSTGAASVVMADSM